MKTLIAEDDITSRLLMQKMLAPYGPYHLAEDGSKAVEYMRVALKMNKPYDLICLDIMMPRMDGHTALKEIRLLEETCGIFPPVRAKIIMTSALADRANITSALMHQCDHYLVKPIEKAKLLDGLHRLGLIEQTE